MGRNRTSQAFFSRIQFPQGLSGSPLIVPTKSSSGTFYDISSVLITSAMDGESSGSKLSGSTGLSRFFGGAHGGGLAEKSAWAIYGDTFLRFSQGKLEAFIQQGPVGNGIIVDGSVKPEKAIGPNKDFERHLSRAGFTPNEAKNLAGAILEISNSDNVTSKLSEPEFKRIFKAMPEKRLQLEVK